MSNLEPDRDLAIAVLNPNVTRPEFSFFQVVKVKTTKEVGVVTGMWYFPHPKILHSGAIS
jgi:hypothetical protein